MKARRWVCPAAGVLLAWSPSSAQDAMSRGDAFRAMHGFGLCVARQRGKAERLLATLPETHEEQTAAYVIAQSEDCDFGGQTLVFSARLMRGVVAEGLLRQDFGRASGPARRRPSRVFAVPGNAEAISESTKGAIGMIEFGACVARADSAKINALLETRAQDEREAMVFRAMAPTFRACLPSGVSIRVNPLQMRGYVFEGAYRNAVASSAGSV